MISNNDNKRISLAMHIMLIEDDINYLAQDELIESKRKTVICERCGVVIEDATVQTIRCRKCAVKHSKEQTAKKRAMAC